MTNENKKIELEHNPTGGPRREEAQADPAAPQRPPQDAEEHLTEEHLTEDQQAEKQQAEDNQPEASEIEGSEPGGNEIEEEVAYEKSLEEMEREFDDDFSDEDADENAAPIESLVEESSEQGEDERRWYILKVQVNRETSICEALLRRVAVAGLDRYFDEVLVPTEDVREFTKSGKQRIVKRKLYPGYIVVKMAINEDSWFLVRETPGIGDFTGAAGEPVSLTDEEIQRILRTTKSEPDSEKSEESIKIGIKYKVGDRVRVKEGNFQNYEGEVSNIDERNGRVTVMINIFNRPNPVELDHWQVEEFE